MRIKEIAKIIGVSPATVSNAFNDRSNISEATKARVLALCREHGYAPPRKQAAHEKERINLIAFNFSDFDRAFYLKIINGVSDCLTENSYDLIVCTNKSSERFLNSDATGGAIVLDSRMSDDTLRAAANPRYPILTMDRMLGHPHLYSLLTDNYPVMCALMQRIVDCGHTDFAFVGGLEGSLDHQERYRAFLDTLQKNGIPFSSDHYYHGDYREKSGARAARIMLLSGALPRVVVCANDNMALGVLRTFRKQGVRVPEDVAVSGFDNIDSAEIAQLTTVEIPRYDSGYLAAKLLLSVIRGEPVSEVTKLQPTIRWRESVK